MKFFVIALALVSSAAFADVQALSFEHLKNACKNPDQYQNQIQPKSIKLDCSDKILKWIPAGEGMFKLPNARYVSYKVSSDKYSVPATKDAVRIDGTEGACPMMKQVEEVIALSQEISCETLEGSAGSATEMCTALLDDLRTSNPAAIQVRETGKVASFCSPAAPEQKQPEQKQPEQKAPEAPKAPAKKKPASQK